jgi:PPK2 family polyphosphate:nucleotide phosphotransferase
MDGQGESDPGAPWTVPRDGRGARLMQRALALRAGVRRLILPSGDGGSLSKALSPAFTGGYESKDQARKELKSNLKKLSSSLDLLHASGTHGLLIIFQALDAAGKDGAIKHVMSGVDPQCCQVTSFKTPSEDEVTHDYLWRCSKALPPRGRVGIFNRSYYEEVIVVRVHRELLEREKVPPGSAPGDLWKRRFGEINNFEMYLECNGIHVVKFFLNVSKEEQKKRFLARLHNPDKNWKYSSADLKERAHWDEYIRVYDEALRHTNTPWAPWFVIPADHKWFTRLAVSEVIVEVLSSLALGVPKASRERRRLCRNAEKSLRQE